MGLSLVLHGAVRLFGQSLFGAYQFEVVPEVSGRVLFPEIPTLVTINIPRQRLLDYPFRPVVDLELFEMGNSVVKVGLDNQLVAIDLFK